MTSIAVFLLLAGGAAYAATHLSKKTHLPKKSVGAKQLKANAVITAKIKKNAVTAAKIRAGAVNGSKIRDGSVTGADVDASSMPFGRAVARFRSDATVPFASETLFPLGPASFTQNAGEDQIYAGSIEISFPASCEAPREAEAGLLLDVANPKEASEEQLAGLTVAKDEKGTSPTVTAEFFGLPGSTPMSKLAPATTTQHSFSIYLIESHCKSGGGITVGNAAIDVLGVK